MTDAREPAFDPSVLVARLAERGVAIDAVTAASVGSFLRPLLELDRALIEYLAGDDSPA